MNFFGKDWVLAHARQPPGIALTDDQFEELSPYLEGYAEHVCDSSPQTQTQTQTQTAFVEQLLADEGLDRAGPEALTEQSRSAALWPWMRP